MKRPARHHAVQFYRDEISLFVTVAEFLGEGLAGGQPAVVIATSSHRAAILDHLCGHVVDCEASRRNGDLVLLDAEEMLSLFMVKGKPDQARFDQNVGGLIEQTLGARPRTVVRAYGEMVDLLWKRGNADGAIKLEMLWNRLAHKHGFSLLCGYSMGHFYEQSQQLAEVSEHHGHGVASDPRVLPFPAR